MANTGKRDPQSHTSKAAFGSMPSNEVKTLPKKAANIVRTENGQELIIMMNNGTLNMLKTN